MKYSIIINNITDNLYAVVMKVWELDKEGNQINVKSLTKAGIPLAEAMETTFKFMKDNG
jgi:hypothetical protein